MGIGDPTLYENYHELQKEILYSQKRSELSSAIDLYTGKKYQDAEDRFVQLIDCGFPNLEMHAKNNLSLMIRRKESANIQKTFWEVLSTVPDSYVFKQMNIALYCIAEEMTDDKRFFAAMRHLQEATDQDREGLLQWWGDVDLVGKDESTLAIRIIEGTYDYNIGE